MGRRWVAWQHLQTRMTDNQWYLMSAEWRLIGLKEAGRKMTGLDQWCHNELDCMAKRSHDWIEIQLLTINTRRSDIFHRSYLRGISSNFPKNKQNIDLITQVWREYQYQHRCQYYRYLDESAPQQTSLGWRTTSEQQTQTFSFVTAFPDRHKPRAAQGPGTEAAVCLPNSLPLAKLFIAPRKSAESIK